MKGFIEVYELQDRQTLVSVNVAAIEMFYNKHICVSSRTMSVKETYSELKVLIEDATAEPKTESRYDMPSFGFSREILKGLSMRKEEQS